MNFNFSNPYTTTRLPVFARNVVSTSHPLAAQAGLRMLYNGGNAVDAAVAAAAAMTICEPVSNGLGSDAFCILWDGQALHGLNASGRAPAAWTPAYFRGKYGQDTQAPPKRGFDAVTVPGAVSSWVALSERFGKLPFRHRTATFQHREHPQRRQTAAFVNGHGCNPRLGRASGFGRRTGGRTAWGRHFDRSRYDHTHRRSATGSACRLSSVRIPTSDAFIGSHRQPRYRRRHRTFCRPDFGFVFG